MAKPLHFERRLCAQEMLFIERLLQLFPDEGVTAFGDLLTAVTNEEITILVVIGMMTADIGIETVELVHKAVSLEKIQRAINRWWLAVSAFVEAL